MALNYNEIDMLKTQNNISGSQDIQSVNEQQLRVILVNDTRNEDLKYGLFKITNGKIKLYNKFIPVSSEKEIFDILDIEFLEPKER